MRRTARAREGIVRERTLTERALAVMKQMMACQPEADLSLYAYSLAAPDIPALFHTDWLGAVM